jgi:hypothetical protein
MIIGSRQRLKNLDHVPKISINGHQIERVYKKEVLGIVIDDRLSWNYPAVRNHCQQGKLE